MSTTFKWVICAICAVLGVIALIYAVIYLTVPIHSLPGFVPGKTATTGHYHKRAALVGVIGILLLIIAALVGVNARRSTGAGVGSMPEPAGGRAPGGTTTAPVGDEGDAVGS